jgi:cation diffusion facilitator CzcD-associated flavoprotein CzcO
MSMGSAFRVAVIGAGASGILATIKLREAGVSDVTVFEKAADLGGTWRDNRYPGITCDVPSHLYRFASEPNPDWSHVCSPGPEILEYLRRVAAKHEVERHIRFNSEVISARYTDGRWSLTTVNGEQGEFGAVIVAVGVLHHPVYPDIEGLRSFSGPAFHTSRWDHSVSLSGKRVGIIGTGSTAVQIVAAIVGDVERLSLFQRTAQWIMPQPNPAIDENKKHRYRTDPAYLQLKYERLARDFNSNFAAAVVGANPEVYNAIAQACLENLESSVKDPVLREKLRPNYQVGCKRLIMHDRFYEAISQPNAEVVTEGIRHVEPRGVRTRDERLHELDVLVLATGFNTHQFMRPMQVLGEGGQSIESIWAKGNEGYLGVTVPGLPNWFMIGGPNSPIGNFSWLMTAEHQLGYALQLIGGLRDRRYRALSPKVSVTRAFNDAIKEKMKDTVWATGCKSWYLDANGQPASWPWTFERFQQMLSEPKLDDYEVVNA